jgi:MAGE family
MKLLLPWCPKYHATTLNYGAVHQVASPCSQIPTTLQTFYSGSCPYPLVFTAMPRINRKRQAVGLFPRATLQASTRTSNTTQPADAHAMDDPDDDVRVRINGNARNQRRRMSNSLALESESYVSESGETQSRESMQSLAQNLVRYALSCEYSRTPIRRADIGTKVLSGGHGRQFKEVFAQAQFMLQTTFGMEMEELPVREKVTNAQKRGMGHCFVLTAFL